MSPNEWNKIFSKRSDDESLVRAFHDIYMMWETIHVFPYIRSHSSMLNICEILSQFLWKHSNTCFCLHMRLLLPLLLRFIHRENFWYRWDYNDEVNFCHHICTCPWENHYYMHVWIVLECAPIKKWHKKFMLHVIDLHGAH